ncbi:hypothetical protein SGLAM104S_04969 [Streptomyces glaucescens]
MHTPRPGRRVVLAGTAAAAALTALPAVHAPARAAGPASAYRWRNVVIGGTGFITGVLFHPAVRGLAYARTDIGGAYRWDERAARWIPLTDHLGWDDWNLLGVEAMAVDPAHPDRLYLAVGTYSQPWSGNGAVLRSADRGRTWQRTDLTVKLGANEDGRGAGERLLVDPRDSGTLWLGTRHDGLLKSTDRGATWAPATGFPATPNPSGQGVTLLVAAGRALYAGWGDTDGTSPNLFRTTDGTTWHPVPGQPAGTAAKVPIRAAYDRHTRELYVTYADAPGPNGQTDGSVHKLATVTGRWTEVTPVKPGGTTSDGSADTFGYGGAAVDARRPGTVVVSTNNRWAAVDTLYRSTDGGRSWTSLKESAVFDVSETPYLKWGGEQPKFGWWIQALAVDPYDSRHLVYGTGATLYGTRDLRHWAPRIRGLEESAVRQLISPPSGPAHLISGLGDIGVMYHERLTASPARGMATNPVFGSATGLAQAAGKPSYVVRTGWGDHGNGAYSTAATAWSSCRSSTSSRTRRSRTCSASSARAAPWSAASSPASPTRTTGSVPAAWTPGCASCSASGSCTSGGRWTRTRAPSATASGAPCGRRRSRPPTTSPRPCPTRAASWTDCPRCCAGTAPGTSPRSPSRTPCVPCWPGSPPTPASARSWTACRPPWRRCAAASCCSCSTTAASR